MPAANSRVPTHAAMTLMVFFIKITSSRSAERYAARAAHGIGKTLPGPGEVLTAL